LSRSKVYYPSSWRIIAGRFFITAEVIEMVVKKVLLLAGAVIFPVGGVASFTLAPSRLGIFSSSEAE
jgi:hypothetical protein